MHSAEVALTVGSGKIELEIVVLWRRARMVRRVWRVRPTWRTLIARLLSKVAARVTRATDQPHAPDDSAGDGAQAADGRPTLRRLTNELKQGPIGLLASSLLRANGCIDAAGIVTLSHKPSSNSPEDPAQKELHGKAQTLPLGDMQQGA